MAIEMSGQRVGTRTPVDQLQNREPRTAYGSGTPCERTSVCIVTRLKIVYKLSRISVHTAFVRRHLPVSYITSDMNGLTTTETCTPTFHKLTYVLHTRTMRVKLRETASGSSS